MSLANMDLNVIGNMTEEELKQALLAAQAEVAEAKKRMNDRPQREVEYSLGEYEGNPTVQIKNDGRPFTIGVKGARAILNNSDAVQALQTKSQEDERFANAIAAIGGNFYRANKVLSHREAIENLLSENNL